MKAHNKLDPALWIYLELVMKERRTFIEPNFHLFANYKIPIYQLRSKVLCGYKVLKSLK